MAMNPGNSAAVSGGPLPTFSRFFSWWFGELSGLFRPGAGGNSPKQAAFVAKLDGETLEFKANTGKSTRELGTVSVSEISGDHPAIRAARRAKKSKQTVALSVPGAWALEKTIRLPASVGDDLNNVIGFEITRQTPFAPHQLHYDYEIVERDHASNSLRVRLIVVPKDAVDGTVAALDRVGLRPDAILFFETEAEPSLSLRLDRAKPAGNNTAGRLRLAGLMAFAGVACLVAATVFPLYAVEKEKDLLRSELDDIRRRTAGVEDMRARINDAIRANSFLHVEKSSSPSILDAFERLSRLIPDNTWLKSIDVNDEKLEIAGLSPQASSLIAVIDGSPRFTDVKFEAPVTRDPGKKVERFVISARIIAPQPAK